jgi:hypothetical protein
MGNLLEGTQNLRHISVISYIHCPECCISSEIKTDADEVMKDPIFCPYCGFFEESELENEEEDEILDDYY